MCAAVALITSPLLAVPHPGHDEDPIELVFKVSKNGDVNIPTAVHIGKWQIKKGKYLFRHLVEDGAHVFVLTEIPKKNGEIPEPAVTRITSVRVVPGRKPSSTTLLAKEDHDFGYRILTIAVAGENLEHMF